MTGSSIWPSCRALSVDSAFLKRKGKEGNPEKKPASGGWFLHLIQMVRLRGGGGVFYNTS